MSNTIFTSAGPFSTTDFTSCASAELRFARYRILVVGAGGLGCEILKSLALSGFRSIDVVDMDTIEVSNLNRQFLFRERDVGRPKCVCAAEFISNRVSGVSVTPHFCRIQDLDDAFYAQFDLVIAGLDSVAARLWLSDNLCRIARETGGQRQIPLIDGGTESWKGHVMLILPLETACMRCQQELFPPPRVFQSCTIASNPRLPEHCVAYAQRVLWERSRGGEKLDGDNDEHIGWVMERARAHARKFGLQEDGIDFKFTKGIVKNIVPAIASTQAIIASMCATEAIKYLTGAAPRLDSGIMYVGDAVTGVNWQKYKYERMEDCEACAGVIVAIPIVEGETVQELMERIKRDYSYDVSAMSSAETDIFMRIKAKTHENLKKPIMSLVEEGEIITATSRTKMEAFEFYLQKQ